MGRRILRRVSWDEVRVLQRTLCVCALAASATTQVYHKSMRIIYRMLLRKETLSHAPLRPSVSFHSLQLQSAFCHQSVVSLASLWLLQECPRHKKAVEVVGRLAIHHVHKGEELIKERVVHKCWCLRRDKEESVSRADFRNAER